MADCVPFARAAAIGEQVSERALLIGCPKFEDWDFNLRRLTEVVQTPIRSLTVVHMEVPCCSGYWHLAQRAAAAAPEPLALQRVVVTVSGDVIAAAGAHA